MILQWLKLPRFKAGLPRIRLSLTHPHQGQALVLLLVQVPLAQILPQEVDLPHQDLDLDHILKLAQFLNLKQKHLFHNHNRLRRLVLLSLRALRS